MLLITTTITIISKNGGTEKMIKYMKISDLEANSKVVNLVAQIDSLDEEGATPAGLKVQDGLLADSTGQVKFSLWGDQVGQHKVGDKIMMNGWCKEFEGELQVSTGKFGKISEVPKEKPE